MSLMVERSPLLTRLRSSSRELGEVLRAPPWRLIVPGTIFVLVAGIGAVTSNMRNAPDAPGSADATSFVPSHSGSNAETLANLKDYTRSIGTEEPASTAAAGKLLPDVDTMIGRLAARLEATPDDIEGWRTLGWSYFHTGRYEEAAAAYAEAVGLDPNSTELKASYEEAKAKVSIAAGGGGDGTSAEKVAELEAMPPQEREAQIRSMVDGLAARLETSPRDVEGWTRLMRSRVVLGDKADAATALRKALEIFKDDKAASSEIEAAAVELGLKVE